MRICSQRYIWLRSKSIRAFSAATSSPERTTNIRKFKDGIALGWNWEQELNGVCMEVLGNPRHQGAPRTPAAALASTRCCPLLLAFPACSQGALRAPSPPTPFWWRYGSKTMPMRNSYTRLRPIPSPSAALPFPPLRFAPRGYWYAPSRPTPFCSLESAAWPLSAQPLPPYPPTTSCPLLRALPMRFQSVLRPPNPPASFW
ncbi:hypothetical protein M422DRAFT_239011 [Sphaerobolus stellatus SS14]|nr:hypothetical protein M422DRAFT_239011 [Sphaerobolus stellatus SS14]